MLEIKNICAGYDKKRVISDISFEVERGSIISVIGPNGCGKSTLMRSIAGSIDIYNGGTVIDGGTEVRHDRDAGGGLLHHLAQCGGVFGLPRLHMALGEGAVAARLVADHQNVIAIRFAAHDQCAAGFFEIHLEPPLQMGRA